MCCCSLATGEFMQITAKHSPTSWDLQRGTQQSFGVLAGHAIGEELYLWPRETRRSTMPCKASTGATSSGISVTRRMAPITLETSYSTGAVIRLPG